MTSHVRHIPLALLVNSAFSALKAWVNHESS